jgi:dethiobiotin synthetase
MQKIIVTGCGTNVGKTIVSAILATALSADYWKPIECGKDTKTIRKLCPLVNIHPPAYSLKAPLSPHAAAKLEHLEIETNKITLPITARPLIIETVGGILVPLNDNSLTLDLFCRWDCQWIIVSKNYLGSINHTLLTIEVLKQRGVNLHSIIFNGKSNQTSEEAILRFSNLVCLARLFKEPKISQEIIKKYAKSWKKELPQR